MSAQLYKAALVGVAMLITLLASGCKERVPVANTPDFYKLHGIVNDGKTTNEITLVNDRNGNRPKLRFPPEIAVSVYTPDTHNPNPKIIRKGFAYEAGVTLELNEKKRLIPIVQTPDHLVYDRVRIRFSASLGSQDSQKTDARLHEIARLSVRTTDKPEWGLREYLPTIAGALQAYDYIPLDENFRSIDGDKMWIGCQVGGAVATENQGPSSCASSFTHFGDLAVSYNFDSRLLPYWREIYHQVINFVDSVEIAPWMTGHS